MQPNNHHHQHKKNNENNQKRKRLKLLLLTLAGGWWLPFFFLRKRKHLKKELKNIAKPSKENKPKSVLTGCLIVLGVLLLLLLIGLSLCTAWNP
jgi:fatty acid desaturase